MLQRVLESAPRYFINTSGKTASANAGQETIDTLPPNTDLKDKQVYGIYFQDEMIGCVDLVRGYPNSKTAMLGLLLLNENFQGQGIGAFAFREIERVVFQWPGFEKIRISVLKNNEGVTPFWVKLGFDPVSVQEDKTVFEKKVTFPFESSLKLTTDRMHLEPVTQGHAPELQVLFSDPELHHFVPYEPFTLEQQLSRCTRWEARRSPDGSEIWLNWAGRDKASGQVMAHFQAGIKTGAEASIGYLVSRSFQNKGFATEGLTAIFQFLKETLKISEVKAWSDTRNHASHQLAKKLGMLQIDFIKNADFFKGTNSDEYVFAKNLNQ